MVIGNKTVSTERQRVVDSLCIRLYILKQLCLSIVYIVLLAMIGVRWKSQTLVHGEDKNKQGRQLPRVYSHN